MYTVPSVMLLLAAGAQSLQLNPTSTESIKAAASSIARGILNMYDHGTVGVNGTEAYQVGTFPSPYYWWECGATWGGLVDYWKYTGDTQYQNATLNALNAQVGPNYDFVPPQQILDEGNDDQAFWVFSALAAHENGFPALPAPTPNYTTLAANAFNDMVGRWYNDSNYCGGGLRWQYTPSQAGYDYKNSISNGGFFNIAARLALATRNQTYADWAEKIYNWTQEIGFLDAATGAVFDGANIPNCTAIDQQQWSYNVAVYLHGAAAMYNYTASAASSATNSSVGNETLWQVRAETLLTGASHTFFTPFANSTGIMYEQQCEEGLTCDNDQWSFKAYLSRFMAKSAILAPSLAANVISLLTASAKGAATACVAGTGTGEAAAATCGTKWYLGQMQGPTGLGQQLAALEVIQSLLLV